MFAAAITNAMAATTLQTIIAYIKLQITNFCLNLLKFVVIYLAFIVTAYQLFGNKHQSKYNYKNKYNQHRNKRLKKTTPAATIRNNISLTGKI
jgi:hypothetical protein